MFKELLKEVFPIIQKSAPTIASALGSPALGIPAMWALSLLGNKFGIDVQHLDHSELVKAMSADPECSDKLCQLESAFGEWFRNSTMQVKLTNAEINIKLSWDSQS